MKEFSRIADTLLRLASIALVSASLLSMTAVSDPGARFNDLGHRMMCTCSCNQVLLECNHVGCPISGGMRQELQARIDRGDNDGLVLQAFVQKYGAVVLAAPTATGFNRIAWIMPFLVLTTGLGGAALLIRRWRLRQAQVHPVSSTGVAETAALEQRRETIRRETEL